VSQPPPNSESASSAVAREEILARLHQPGLALVDVLPREAFEGEHIPGSLNLPLAELTERARQILPQLAQDIVVYCASFT
jgi:rhodanese-related sulfurtransferase